MLNSAFLACLVVIRAAVAWGGEHAAAGGPLGAAAVAIHLIEVPTFCILQHRNMSRDDATRARYSAFEHFASILILAFVAANPFLFYFRLFRAPVRV